MAVYGGGILAGILAGIAHAGFLFDLFDESGNLDLAVVSSPESSGPEADLLRTLDALAGAPSEPGPGS